MTNDSMRRFINHRVQASLIAGCIWAACNTASAFELRVNMEPHPGGPVYWKPEAPFPKEHKIALLNVKTGKTTPAQQDEQGRVWWWAEAAKEKSETAYEIVPAPAQAARERVKVGEAKDEVIEITVDGKPFTSFNFKKDEVRPYLYPVIGPTGDGVTRDFPMKNTEAEKKDPAGHDRQDHHHHRSIWTAHGEVVAGDRKEHTDYWAETPETGVQKVKNIVRTTSGPVFGEIEAEIDWSRRDGTRELSENRTYMFFRGDNDNRFIDVTVALHFPDSDVTFLDTKEGGMVALRVAIWMDEISGGHMVNAKGGEGMKECWGKPAEWCDYFGKLKDQTIGIAVMDAKTNHKHPTEWHIRDYGLYTANPFGSKAFSGGKGEDATKTWKQGENETFNYRILIHKGDTEAAHIAEQYRLYTEPLEATAVNTREVKPADTVK